MSVNLLDLIPKKMLSDEVNENGNINVLKPKL